jgi:hypothetical protein
VATGQVWSSALLTWLDGAPPRVPPSAAPRAEREGPGAGGGAQSATWVLAEVSGKSAAPPFSAAYADRDAPIIGFIAAIPQISRNPVRVAIFGIDLSWSEAMPGRP